MVFICANTMPHVNQHKDLISVIITVLNGDKWIESCMKSIVQQTAVQKCHCRDAQTPFMSNITSSPTTTSSNTATINTIHQQSAHAATSFHTTEKCHTDDSSVDDSCNVQLEVCVFDDCSCDNTYHNLCQWQKILKDSFEIEMQIIQNNAGKSKGVGFGRNRAIEASKGMYLCFQDIDDEMLPERILKQYLLAREHQNAIIGSKFMRNNNATCRFTKWANHLSSDKLMLQVYTSNGPTIVMPTWMCHRNVYNKVKGGFCEEGKGCPEDLIFFYRHLDNEGTIYRVEESLLIYRYHNEATTFTVQAKTIWHIRLKYLLENVLKHKPWSEGFSIWNAGKQGRKFFRDLPQGEKKKVKTFCDVDKNKINKCYKYYDPQTRQQTFSIPICHFSVVQPPLIICMKLDLTNGDFEANLQSLNLKEGQDYILFT